MADKIGALLQVARALAGRAPTRGALQAYHFSPYKFDKFDLSKLGTGENYHDFGHGLYFAENSDVVDWYRRTLGGGSGYRYKVQLDTPRDSLLDWDAYLRDQGLPNDYRLPELADSAGVDPAHVSSLLAAEKLPGIRYLDSRSRKLGQGTSNYSIFDDSLIQNLGNYAHGGLL